MEWKDLPVGALRRISGTRKEDPVDWKNFSFERTGYNVEIHKNLLITMPDGTMIRLRDAKADFPTLTGTNFIGEPLTVVLPRGASIQYLVSEGEAPAISFSRVLFWGIIVPVLSVSLALAYTAWDLLSMFGFL